MINDALVQTAEQFEATLALQHFGEARPIRRFEIWKLFDKYGIKFNNCSPKSVLMPMLQHEYMNGTFNKEPVKLAEKQAVELVGPEGSAPNPNGVAKFASMKRGQLIKAAKQAGIEGCFNMKNVQLIEALEAL